MKKCLPLDFGQHWLWVPGAGTDNFKGIFRQADLSIPQSGLPTPAPSAAMPPMRAIFGLDHAIRMR